LGVQRDHDAIRVDAGSLTFDAASFSIQERSAASEKDAATPAKKGTLRARAVHKCRFDRSPTTAAGWPSTLEGNMGKKGGS